MVPRAVPTIILTASGEYDSVQCPFVSGSQGRGPRAPPPTPPASPPPPPPALAPGSSPTHARCRAAALAKNKSSWLHSNEFGFLNSSFSSSSPKSAPALNLW